MTTGISSGVPLLSVVVDVIVVDEVRSAYCEKVVGANFGPSAHLEFQYWLSGQTVATTCDPALFVSVKMVSPETELKGDSFDV